MFLKFDINRKLVLEYAKKRKLIKHIGIGFIQIHHVYEISSYYSLLFSMYYLTNIKKFVWNCRILPSQNCFSSPLFRMAIFLILDDHVRNINNLDLNEFVTFTIAVATELPADTVLALVLEQKMASLLLSCHFRIPCIQHFGFYSFQSFVYFFFILYFIEI